MSDIVHLHRSDRVLEIIIDHPPANAINRDISTLIYEACCLLQDDNDLSVGIISGAGDKIFSAGWEVMPAIYNLPLEQAFAETKPDNPRLPLYQKMLNSEDVLEGARAFAEKRKPVWTSK